MARKPRSPTKGKRKSSRITKSSSNRASLFRRLLNLFKRSEKPLRRLSGSELKKIGASIGSERYVKASIKRIRKSTKTISKRQYQKARRGGVTAEVYAKSRKPTVRVLKSTVGTEFQEASFNLPLNQAGFDRRVREIRRLVLPRHPDADAAIVWEYKNGHAFTGALHFLSSIDWDTDVAQVTDQHLNKQGSGHTLAMVELKRLTLKVRYR
jgi:hypothetical protein